MSGTNQFLPFATGGGANTLTPSAYAALTTLLSNGFQSGVADSAKFNTVLRQASFVVSAIAQTIADVTGGNVNDDGVVANFENQFLSLFQKTPQIIAHAGGAADAINATFYPAITQATNGMTLYVRASSANATTTPTFTPNSGVIATKFIVKGAGSALSVGDIAGSGHWLELQYDATLDKWVLLNPATGIEGSLLRRASPMNINSGAVLTASHVGRCLYYYSESAGTITLPDTPKTGDTISLYVIASGVLTIQRAASFDIYAQGQLGVSSFSLGRGASITLCFDGGNWVEVAGNNSIGYSQTWHNVSGSRVSGTTYYNNNGRPMEVYAANSVAGIAVEVGGVVVTPSTTGVYNVCFIVPTGLGYKMTGTLTTVSELY